MADGTRDPLRGARSSLTPRLGWRQLAQRSYRPRNMGPVRRQELDATKYLRLEVALRGRGWRSNCAFPIRFALPGLHLVFTFRRTKTVASNVSGLSKRVGEVFDVGGLATSPRA